MDDRMKESISALMDDESNELELQRVLSNADVELSETWHRYHQIRRVIRDEQGVMNIDIRQSLALELDYAESEVERSPVAAIQAEPVTPEKLTQTRRKFASLAVAASVVFALVLVSRFETQPTPEQSTVIAASTAPAEQALVSVGNAVVQDSQPRIIVDFDEAHAKRFNEYLLRHAEQSIYGSRQGIMPLARVASVNSVGI